MGKKLLQIIAVLAVALFMAGPLCAKPWGIVATDPDYYGYYSGSPDYDNETDNESIHVVDLGQTPPVVYGPFLAGQLTPERGAGVFDIALFKGGKRALISTFGDSKVHMVDLKNPANPVLMGSIELPFFAEDIAITKNGKLALVTDGGFSPTVAFIDLKTFTLTSVFDLGEKSAQAVAISPNGKIAIFADYFGGAIHYGRINKMRNGLESVRTIALCDAGQYDNATDCMGPVGLPVNVTISPNGRTVLVAISNGGAIAAFELTGKGDLIPGNPFILTGLPGGPISNNWSNDGGNQSIAFQNDKTAYVLSQRINLPDGDEAVVRDGQVEYPDADGERPNQLCQINILGPGRTEYVTARFTLLNSGSSQLFGVDTLAIYNRYALVGNPTKSISNPYDNPYYNNVAFIDLVTGVLTPIELNNYGVASGVAIKP